MKICIFVYNSGIAKVDCSDLKKGNPGIGGTEYSMFYLAQIYKEYYPQDEIFLIISEQGMLPAVDRVIINQRLLDIPSAAKENGADILLISSLYNGKPLPASFFAEVDKARINTITWGHNFYLSDYCKLLVNCEYVKANVFVGRQQYDRYIDHKVIKKSTFIFNMYPTKESHREAVNNQTVTYIGSLVPMKGFQVLASAWKQIKAAVPDAELNVIGSGSLYSRDAQLGPYGIADRCFETQIMPGLTDEKGEILPSVHFLGVLGAEKEVVIADTAVGVVNPTGRTETFGISALDFESMGVPVVTIAKGGFLDTVVNGETGILYRNKSDIVNAVVSLLTDRRKNEEYGRNGITLSKKFAPENIIGQWHSLFVLVSEGKSIRYIKPETFRSTGLKWLRIFNKAIHNPVSVIQAETAARKLLRRLGK